MVSYDYGTFIFMDTWDDVPMELVQFSSCDKYSLASSHRATIQLYGTNNFSVIRRLYFSNDKELNLIENGKARFLEKMWSDMIMENV